MLDGGFVCVFRIGANHPGRELVVRVQNEIINVKDTGGQIDQCVAQFHRVVTLVYHVMS